MLDHKTFFEHISLVPNVKGKLWFFSGYTLLLMQRIFIRPRKDANKALIVSIGRYDNNAVSTSNLLKASLEKSVSLDYIYEHYYPNNKDKLKEFDRLLMNVQSTSSKLTLNNLGNKKNSFFNNTKKKIVLRYFRFLEQAFLLNTFFLGNNYEWIVLGNDTHYPARYVALLSRLFRVRSYTLQASGSNEVHKDSVPYYPLFTNSIINWSSYYSEKYKKEYCFGNSVSFLPWGVPKYDGIVTDSVSGNKIVVVSNTQFYVRDSKTLGDKIYKSFAEMVLSLLNDSKLKDRVVVKLHPRENLDDLYTKCDSWSEEFKQQFVFTDLTELFKGAAVVLSLGSTAVFEGLIHNVPCIIFGDKDSEVTSTGPWNYGGPLEEQGLISIYDDVSLIKKAIEENEYPNGNLKSIISNLGNASNLIISNIEQGL